MKKTEHAATLGVFIAIGIALGVAFGNVGIGLTVGIIVWALVGLYKQRQKQMADDPDEKFGE
jgi:F0F1-type ATP synthase membrane subunit c/vacuolar-type H+-ATPase subunit K